MADTTFWSETDGKDETFGIDETTTFDDAQDASLFMSSWMEFEGIAQGLTDSLTTSFEMGNKVLFLTGTDFIYYDGTTSGKVADIAYIPTITLGRKTTGGGTPNEKLNHLSNSWWDSFDPDGVATTFPMSYAGLSTKPLIAVLNGVDKAETTHFTVDRTTGIVTWGTVPPAGTDTLTIRADKDGLMDPTAITNCNMCVEFGGKNNSMVFVAGNTSFPNVARYCWVYDPTYWPEDSDISVGNDSRSITGFGRLNDFLVTYKEPGDEFVQWYSDLSLDTAGMISVSTSGLNNEYGCVAPRTVHPAQDGLLALSDKGVVWTWPSFVKGQASCNLTSQGVNGKNGRANGILDNTKEDLANAHAEISGTKYLLHIKDKVWVLDLDYTDLANRQYCWYPYTGTPGNAGTFYNRDGILHIGDKSAGFIYREKQAEDSELYSDNGQDPTAIIDAWWTSPLMFLGGRNWIKKFIRILLNFKVMAGLEHILTFITDQGAEDIPLRQEAGVFDARYFDSEHFNAGVFNVDYPSDQPEKIGYKGEYFQFKIRNNQWNRGMVMLAANIYYSLLKISK